MSQKKRSKKENSKLLIAEAVIVGVLVVGVLGYAVVRQARSYVNEQDAIRIDGEKFTVSDVNYFFYTYYDSFREQNAEYLSYMIDDSKPLTEQEYEEGTSWFAHLLDESIDSMVSVVTVANAAESDGFELNEESREGIQDYLDGISAVAETQKISADSYVKQIYGNDMTLERYGELLTKSFLARDYSLSKQNDTAVSEEDIEKQFESDKNKYEFVSYERLYFKATEAKEEVKEEKKEEAKALAEEALARLRQGETLKGLSEEYEGTVYYESEEAYYSNGYAYGDWLFSDERKAGDSELLEDEKGYYVMVFRDKFRHEYQTVNIRDVHFPVNSSAENPEELYEKSCTEAEEFLAAWKEKGGTEEAFEVLGAEQDAQEKQGILQENVLKGEMDSYVEHWSFDETRKPGDCEVIYADNGFHVLYFSGTGETAWKIEAEKDFRENKLQSFMDSLIEKADVKRNEEALEKAASGLNNR